MTDRCSYVENRGQCILAPHPARIAHAFAPARSILDVVPHTEHDAQAALQALAASIGIVPGLSLQPIDLILLAAERCRSNVIAMPQPRRFDPPIFELAPMLDRLLEQSDELRRSLADASAMVAVVQLEPIARLVLLERLALAGELIAGELATINARKDAGDVDEAPRAAWLEKDGPTDG